MYSGNQIHYCNNLCYNQHSSQWGHFPSYNHFNVCCEPKKMICEPSVTKGLIQTLKDKIISLQSDSLRFKFGKKPVKRKQNEYYCLMLRKINTLEKKLQNVEDLYASRIDPQEEDLCDSEYLCDYLTFHDSVRSLIDLANQLKEEIYSKSDTQFKNQNLFQLYNRIHVLESDLQDLFLYLEQLQNFRRVYDQDKSFYKKYKYTENFVPLHPNDRMVDKTQPQIGKGFLQPEQKKSKYNRSKKSKKDNQSFDQTTINTNNDIENLAELEEPLPSEVLVKIDAVKIKSKKKITKRSKGEQNSSKMSPNSTSKQFQTQIVNYNKIKTNESKDDFLHNNFYKHNGHTIFPEEKTEKSGRRIFNSKPPCYHLAQPSSKTSICSCESCVAQEERWSHLNKHTNNSLEQSPNNSVCSCRLCNHNSDRKQIPIIYKTPYNNKKMLFVQPKIAKMNFDRILRGKNNFHLKNKTICPQNVEGSYDEERDICSCEPNITHKKKGLKNMRQLPIRQTKQIYHNGLYIPSHQYRLRNKLESNQKKQAKPVHRPLIPNVQSDNHEKHIKTVYYYDISPDEDDVTKKQDRQQHKHDEQVSSEKHVKKQTNNSLNFPKRGRYKRQFGDFQDQSNNLKKDFVSNKRFGRHFPNEDNWYRNSIESDSSNSENEESKYDKKTPYHVPLKKNLPPSRHLHIKIYEHEELQEQRKLQRNGDKNGKFNQGGPHQPLRFYERKRFNDWPYDDNWQKHRPFNGGQNEFYRWHHQNYNKFNKPFVHKYRSFHSVNQNEYSSDDSSHNCRINICDNPKCRNDNNPDDMVVFLENTDSSSLSEDSTLKKMINSLKDFETDVCEKCIVKEKKIKLIPKDATNFNGKGKTKVILKKEIIKCPSCRKKLDTNIFKATQTWSNNNIQDSESNTNFGEDKMPTKVYSEEIQKENTNKSRTNLTVSPVRMLETRNNKTEDVWSLSQSKKPLPIFQTQVDQGDIFKHIHSHNIAESQKSLDVPNYGNTININIEKGSYSIETSTNKKNQQITKDTVVNDNHSNHSALNKRLYSEKGNKDIHPHSKDETGSNKRSMNDQTKPNSEESTNTNSVTVSKGSDREGKKQDLFIGKSDLKNENVALYNKSTAMSKSSKTTVFQSLLVKSVEEELPTITNDTYQDESKDDTMSQKNNSEKELFTKVDYLEQNENTKVTETKSKDKFIDKKVSKIQNNKKLNCKDYLYTNNVPYKPLSHNTPCTYPVLTKVNGNVFSERKRTKSKEIMNYFQKKCNSINQGRRASKQFKHPQTGYRRISSKDCLRNTTRKQFRNGYLNSLNHNLNETSSDTKIDLNNNMTSITSESSFSVLNWEKVASKLKEEQNLS